MDNAVAEKLMASTAGFFRKTRYENKPQKTVFEFTEDLVFGYEVGRSMFSICLWVGDILEPTI